MALKTFLCLFVALSLADVVLGHGRLIDPASRNAAWRFGFKNPKNYNDNEQNCGGYSIQWETNNGKCGVCGDPYHRTDQEHVHPGEKKNGNMRKKKYKEMEGKTKQKHGELETKVNKSQHHFCRSV